MIIKLRPYKIYCKVESLNKILIFGVTEIEKYSDLAFQILIYFLFIKKRAII